MIYELLEHHPFHWFKKDLQCRCWTLLSSLLTSLSQLFLMRHTSTPLAIPSHWHCSEDGGCALWSRCG